MHRYERLLCTDCIHMKLTDWQYIFIQLCFQIYQGVLYFVFCVSYLIWNRTRHPRVSKWFGVIIFLIVFFLSDLKKFIKYFCYTYILWCCLNDIGNVP